MIGSLRTLQTRPARAGGRPLVLATLFVLIALLFALQSSRPADAAPQFQPSNTFTLSSTALGATADVTATFSLPSGHLAPAETSLHFPPQSDLHDQTSPGSAPAIGQVIGTVETTETLGIAGLNCNSAFGREWVLVNAVSDADAGTVQADPDPPSIPSSFNYGRMSPFISDNGAASDGSPSAQTTAGNGLVAGVEEYPAFLETLFYAGGPIYPDARYFAAGIAGNIAFTLNLMVFGPGDLAAIAPPNPLSDFSATQFGYSYILVIDDPTEVAAPSPVSDICSPMSMNTVLFGQSRTNGCMPSGACPAGANIISPCSVPLDATPPIVPQCSALTAAGTRHENPGTAESGACVTACTRMFLSTQISQRDLDGDGYENAFDTCPTVFTDPLIFDARTASSDFDDDPDSDGIPGGGPAGGCDPSPNTANDDGDTWPVNGDDWVNTLDNCPLVANGMQSETELPAGGAARPRGGPQTDGMGFECDGAENDAPACPTNALPDCGTANACTNAVDDDLDGPVNDGCPFVGSQKEKGCLNAIDDPDEDDSTLGAQNDDSVVNDGCPSSAFVANGLYMVSMSKTPVCFTNSGPANDTDSDGWCDVTTALDAGGYPYASPADPNDNNASIRPEAYHGTYFPMPVAASGAAGNGLGRSPVQECNDGLDNDGDTLVDLLDSAAGGCRPPSPLVLRTADSDGDGYSDEAELHIGTDALGRCEVGVVPPAAPGTSSDWPADVNDAGGTSRDQVNTADLALFTAGMRMNTSPGSPTFDRRFDMVPGPGPLSSWINTLDLAQVTTFIPPMFGVKAFNYSATDCTPHPIYSD